MYRQLPELYNSFALLIIFKTLNRLQFKTLRRFLTILLRDYVFGKFQKKRHVTT